MADALDSDALFRAKYSQELEALQRLTALGRDKIGGGAEDNINLLGKIATGGLVKTISRRGEAGKEEVRELVREFVLYGAKAVLLTGSQRGGDFLNNQLRGQWAERVALSLPVPGLKMVPFGPSGAAMPGEQDHRKVIMTFKEIQLLEGKRPDLLGFKVAAWDALTPAEKALAQQWPERPLEQADKSIIRKALFGAEVKNSTWHYAKRRAAGGGSLSITVKKEEVGDIQRWSRNTRLPVIFLQVLFDEMYCMSFRRMEAAIKRERLYEDGDYELDEQTGEKIYHKFHLVGDRHLCGKVVFPSESTAEVRTLEDGNIVPFIRYEPALATDPVQDVVFREIRHVEPSTPPAGPQTPAP